MTLEISFLADRPEYCDEIADWLHAEWGWFTPGSTIESRREKVRGHLNREKLPLAVVADESGIPLGTAALRLEDMDTRPHLSPWLASVYVTPSARGQGIGARLVSRIEKEARRLGYHTLYLMTFDKSSYYSRRGWSQAEVARYREEQVVVMSKSLE